MKSCSEIRDLIAIVLPLNDLIIGSDKVHHKS